jgi:phytoene/squalene synthetase
VDSPLVLEVVKALAPPVAAVLAVFIASDRAVRAFRYQKLIERRLDWYETAINALFKAPDSFQAMMEELDEEAVRKALDAIQEISTLSHGSFMYAEKEGYQALIDWSSRVKALVPFPKDKPGRLDSARQFKKGCYRTARLLVHEMRKELRLRPFSPELGARRGN